MTDGAIECYDTFITKGCLDELLFGDFHDQPIPPDYYDLLNDDDGDDDDNNIPGTPIDMTALPQTSTPSKTKYYKLKEWTRKMKE